MKKYISRFHYLTQDVPGHTHIQQVETACMAGANWIQYRCLTKPDGELLADIHQIASICDDWGATLIIANHYHLLPQVDAQGVHIEDKGADLAAIREYIGDDKTLGASAASLEQLQKLQSAGVADYVGYGPFAHTDTLANDYKVLGFEGYRQLQRYNINLPLIAVGGIQLTDVEPLMQTGVDGIAVSSAINLALDPAGAVKAFYQKVY